MYDHMSTNNDQMSTLYDQMSTMSDHLSNMYDPMSTMHGDMSILIMCPLLVVECSPLMSCVCTCRAVESEDATETEALLSAAEQGQAGTGKFFYFSTFVQAALIVHELHLLDVASLRQVGSLYTYATVHSVSVPAIILPYWMSMPAIIHCDLQTFVVLLTVAWSCSQAPYVIKCTQAQASCCCSFNP